MVTCPINEQNRFFGSTMRYLFYQKNYIILTLPDKLKSEFDFSKITLIFFTCTYGMFRAAASQVTTTDKNCPLIVIKCVGKWRKARGLALGPRFLNFIFEAI
jgi:hypothetical protein